jgi:hypothetical protein
MSRVVQGQTRLLAVLVNWARSGPPFQYSGNANVTRCCCSGA